MKEEEIIEKALRDSVNEYSATAQRTVLRENLGKHIYEIGLLWNAWKTGARNFLDIGGGVGINFLTLRRMTHGECVLVLCDRFEEYTAENIMGDSQNGIAIMEKAGVQVINQDLLAKPVLPLDDSSIHVATCFDVIEHFPCHPLNLFLEIKRVLKPGGTLAISGPNVLSWQKHLALWSGDHPFIPLDLWVKDKYWSHFREYSEKEFTALLAIAKFHNIETRSLTEPTKTLLRQKFWGRHDHSKPTPRNLMSGLLFRGFYWLELLFPRFRSTIYGMGTKI